MGKAKEGRKLTTRTHVNTWMQKVSILLILIAIIVIASLLTPKFLSVKNFMNIARQIAVVMIIAYAETTLIIAGMIDLSPGSVLALSGCIGVSTAMATGSVVMGLLVSIGIGLVCGLVAGFTITRFNVPPFIVTLAIMNAARGLALVFMGGKPVYNIGNFTVWGQGQLGPIPYSMIIMIVVGIFAWFMLSHTRFGRYIYAVGGNQDAAQASGINVKAVKIKAFLFAGACSGLAGALLMSRMAGALPDAGVSYEFDGITAAVVGGTSMTGGVGTIFGTVIGAIIVGIINNVLNLLGVQAYWQQIVKGVIIAVAVILDITTKGRQKSAKVLLKESSAAKPAV